MNFYITLLQFFRVNSLYKKNKMIILYGEMGGVIITISLTNYIQKEKFTCSASNFQKRKESLQLI